MVKFKINIVNGKKNGYTEFFDDNGKLEARYWYVNDNCDYLKSEGFPKGSLAESRVNACKKKNKKEKIKDEIKKYRFFSLEKGYYSLDNL